jgi:hypothetical protein
MVWMDNSFLWAGCGEGFAVGLVRVWWFVVVRSVGFLLASVSAFTSKRPRPRPTTPQVDVILKKLMPFPELEALAAQSLLTAVSTIVIKNCHQQLSCIHSSCSIQMEEDIVADRSAIQG